jgi:hypothetical protein
MGPPLPGREESAMSTTRHVRSIHIHAPVEKVFDYVQDPVHFYDAMPNRMRPKLRAVNVTPEGVGTTYEWAMARLAGVELVGVMTRQEYVVNERIMDRSSTGPEWTWTVEPEGDGTSLTLAFEYSTKIPMIDKVIDTVFWRGDRDIDAILAAIEDEVESLTRA